MKKFALVAVILLSCHLALLAQQNSAPPSRHIGDIGYVPPTGWKLVTETAQMHVFLSPDAKENSQALIIIGTGPLAAGNLKEAFNNQVKRSMGNLTMLSSSALREEKTTEGFELLMQSFSAEGANKEKLYGVYVGANVNGELLVISLAANDAGVFSGSQQDFTTFLTHVKLPPPQRAQAQTYTTPPPVAGDAASVEKSEFARRKPNTVSGNIYDAQGRPFRIPGAKVVVHVWGSGSNGDRAGFNIPMDANGHYESVMPSGLYGIHARAYLPLNGNIVCQDLEPLDGQPTEQAVHSAPGIVKDFALRLTGLMAGGNAGTIQGYYGGKLTVTDGDDWKNPWFGSLTKTYPAGSKVLVTLVPQSPLIDGSRGQVLTLECPIEQMAGGGVHKVNIPLAAYRASAKLVTPDGRERPMRVALLPGSQFADAVTLYYQPDTDDHDGRPVVPNMLVASN